MAALDSRLRVRPDPRSGRVCLDSEESIPAGYAHELLPSVAYRLALETIHAAMRVDSIGPKNREIIELAIEIIAQATGVTLPEDPDADAR